MPPPPQAGPCSRWRNSGYRRRSGTAELYFADVANPNVSKRHRGGTDRSIQAGSRSEHREITSGSPRIRTGEGRYRMNQQHNECCKENGSRRPPPTNTKATTLLGSFLPTPLWGTHSVRHRKFHSIFKFSWVECRSWGRMSPGIGQESIPKARSGRDSVVHTFRFRALSR